jgi:L-ascorbate metabolism protein UlaG (beta-lactamase superfamily)
MRETFDPRCELSVLAEPASDSTSHEDLGCGLQGPASRAVRRALDPFRARVRRLGSTKALAQAGQLVDWLEDRPEWRALCTSRRIAGRRELRKDALYGDPGGLVPRVLHVRQLDEAFDWDVAPDAWPGLADLVSALSQGASRPAIDRLAAQSGHADFVAELRAAGWLRTDTPEPAPKQAHGPGLWFVGHNSVLVASRTTRILIDPWLRPWRDADPDGYRPLRAGDLGRIDAIAITHSHGDHFHLGSLLAFPRDTPIFVPYVARESILATDLAARLAQVGFTRIVAVKWWNRLRVGDLWLEALPFYGEQATSIELVYPELRNAGNTWIVRTPAVSAAFLADTGRDGAGSMVGAALEAVRKWGPVDVVFGGMRGFSLFPLFLPFTTLDAMFVNVPRELLAVRQELMHDGPQLLSAAECLGASHVVPYADGGAPWYRREGMGPSYPEYPSYPGVSEPVGGREDPDSAPFPERLQEAAERRYGPQPLVEPLLLRPGDLVRWEKSGPRIGQVEGFGWPWA